jgi:glycosyltransferase involved in cell wall biosynthesis
MTASAPIFFFTDSAAFGGAEQALVTLMAELDRERWEPTLVHHAAPGLEPLLEATRALGVATWPVPAMPEGAKGAARIPRFAAALRRRRPSVFHAQQTWQRSCKYALFAARLARVPVTIATVQLYVELEHDRHTALQRSLLSWSVDRFIAVSEHVRERLEEDLGLPARKIEVIHNAVDAAAARRPADPELRSELNGGARGPLVLVPARLDPQKGHRDLLQAAVEVPGVTFVLAGDGPEREALEELAHTLGVEERVLFLGYRADVPALLAASDLVVLPSLYEGLPLSLLEAMAAEKPVIASRIGGVDELVSDGKSGLLVPPGDPSALASAIRGLLDDRDRAARLAGAGREVVERNFSSAAMEARVSRIYGDIAHAKGAPR